MQAPGWWWNRAPRGWSRLCVGALTPLGWAYGAAVARRAGTPTRVAARVYSVGNLTIGGSGKTPLVQWLARHLTAGGRRVVVLSRGYGGPTPRAPLAISDGGMLCEQAWRYDEPSEIALSCPGVPVVVSPCRVTGARFALERFGAEALVLDDGFQHRALARDVDVVAVDAARGLGNGRCLPAGPLRERPGALARATLVVLTRADGDTSELCAALRRYTAAPIVSVRFEVAGICGLLDGNDAPVEELGEVTLLSGIAQPAAFERDVAALGIRVATHWVYPDHAVFTRAVIQRLAKAPTPRVLVTAKDAVKLRALLTPAPPAGLPWIGVVALRVAAASALRLAEALATTE